MYYDPLISKLIVWAPTRADAIERMKRALYEYKITGVKTNISFVQSIMQAQPFVDGNYNTHFIDDHIDELTKPDTSDEESEDIAMIMAYLDYQNQQNKRMDFTKKQSPGGSNWKNFGRLFRHNPY